MTPELDFQALIDGLRRGEPDAAQQIFHRFGQRLIALGRSRLHGQVRQRVDAEDVMQSVFKSFFRRQADEAFDLDSWDGLWALLTVITLRKCGFRTRYYRAQCRDVQREATPAAAAEDSVASWQAISREPTASEAAMLNETVAELLGGLSERDRQIIELVLQGCSTAEISVQVGRSERAVQRLLARVRQRLDRQGAEEDTPDAGS